VARGATPSWERTIRLMRACSHVLLGATAARDVPRDTCILHTHGAMQILSRLGVRCRPLPVQVQAFNPVIAEYMRAGHNPEDLTPQEWEARGGWSVGVGFNTRDGIQTREGAWDGHLVLLVRERFLLDLTADQLARPDRGLVIPRDGLCVEAREFVKGKRPDATVELDGSIVAYWHHRGPTAKRYVDHQWRPWDPGIVVDLVQRTELLSRRLANPAPPEPAPVWTPKGLNQPMRVA
jgi:hypothetical protein